MVDITKYLADHPPTVVPLSIKPHFEALNQEQKLYAHHLSRFVTPLLLALYNVLFLPPFSIRYSQFSIVHSPFSHKRENQS